MAQRKNKNRKEQVQNFKNKKMEQNKQSEKKEQPKRQLIPSPEWNNTDFLEMRGDLLQALDMSLTEAFEAGNQMLHSLQRAGQVIQMMIGHNIKQGKMELKYVWSNNGDYATDKEVEQFKAELDKLNKQREELLKTAETGIKEELEQRKNVEEETNDEAPATIVDDFPDVAPREVVTLSEIIARDEPEENFSNEESITLTDEQQEGIINEAFPESESGDSDAKTEQE